MESYTADIDWAMLEAHCGLSQVSSSDLIIFTGTVTVHTIDHVSIDRDSDIIRDTYSPYTFTVTFPRNVEVNSSALAIFAPISVQAAIIRQEYNKNSLEGLIQLFTSVQYPFFLSGATITATNGLDVSIVQGTTVSCPTGFPSGSANAAACNVIFDISVIEACNLNGTYTVHFDIQCQPEVNSLDCPLQGESVNITFSTWSNNFCGKFGNEIDLSVSMQSYLPDGSTPRNAFLPDQVMYFRAQTSSSMVQLSDTYLINCSSVYNTDAAILIYSGGSLAGNGSPQGLGSGAAFTVGTHTNATAEFNLKATNALYPVPVDESRPAYITCWIGVDYVNNIAKRSSSHINVNLGKSAVALNKRAVTSSSSTQASASFRVGEDTTVENGASSLTSVSLVFCILSALVVALL